MKKLIAVILVAILMAGTSVAYAWWDNLSNTQEQTIQIGEGVSISVQAVAKAEKGKVLVPQGVVLKENDINQIDLTYIVQLDSAVQNDLTLVVKSSNILIGGSSKNANLVNIKIDQESKMINSDEVVVKVTMSLSMPASEDIYKEIANQLITFDINFSAE